MSQNAGDFSDRRNSRSTFEERGVLSSMKKRPKLPRNLQKLAPLNFEEIQKEIEEYEQDQNRSVLLQEEQNKIIAQNVLNDISNENKTKSAETKSTHPKTVDGVGPSIIVTECKSTPLTEKPNVARKMDDSFDFNFSALRISSPVKNLDKVASTPNHKLHVCHEGIETNFNDFVTPRQNNKYSQPAIAYSISRKPFNKFFNKDTNESFAHEVVPTPVKKSQEVLCTIPKNIPKDDTFKKIKVKNTDYIILNLLGKGGSSEVFQCFCIGTKEIVAIKCVSLSNKVQATGYINEVKLLQQLQKCDRIVTMLDYEIVEHENKLLMVLEKGNSDLSKVMENLAKREHHIPLYKLLFYWMEMLYAVKQIHDHGVIHSDLKPANFLEVSNGLKLIDFGIASSVQPDMTSVLKPCPEGSCNYISPEALKETSCSNQANYKIHFKSDVWSLGCILYQLIYRKTPFQHIKQIYSKLAIIMNPDHKIEYPETDWIPAEFENVMKKCLRYNVQERPSIQDLILEFETMLASWNN